MLLDAKLHCLHTISTQDLAGKKEKYHDGSFRTLKSLKNNRWFPERSRNAIFLGYGNVPGKMVWVSRGLPGNYFVGEYSVGFWLQVLVYGTMVMVRSRLVVLTFL